MFEKIIAFFMSIIAFFMSLFGLDTAAKVNEYKNLAYGTEERQVMDLYLPKEHDGEVGLILMIHGGAWISGDKSSNSDTAKNACKNFGYATASISYRYISDTVHMEDLLDDIEASLAKIKQVGEENGIKINKVLLTGQSAGGHLALLYGYSRVDSAPIKPAAVVSFCGVTNLNDENFYVNNALGDEEVIADLFSWAGGVDYDYDERLIALPALAKISPVNYVNANTVPTVINHGNKDTIVPYSNAVLLDQKLTQHGVTHVFNTYEGADHDLAGDEAAEDRAYDLLVEYAAKYLN